MDEHFFRTSMLVAVLCILPFALYYRFRSNSGEKLDRWQEGAFILFGLRLSGVPCAVGSIAWLIEPQWMAWASVPLPNWLRLIGIGMVVLWGVLLISTIHHLGRNLTDTVVTRVNHTLVTTGPYRFVRHPFYLAGAIALLGGSLAAANWFILLSGCVPLAFLVVRTRTEEHKLVDRFGDDYRQYMARTGRFLPRFRNSESPV